MPRSRQSSPRPVKRSSSSTNGNGAPAETKRVEKADGLEAEADAARGAGKDPKITKGFQPDMTKPLVGQVRFMGRDDYIKWVHTPYVFPNKKAARFFGPSFFEFFSRTPWYVVPLVWLPVSAFLVYYFNFEQKEVATPWRVIAANYLIGMLVWTFIEYALHRWLFHVDDILPDNGWALTGHFLLHGVHHRIPMDRHRLVMPPALLTPLVLLVHGIWGGLLNRWIQSPPDVYYTMFAGAMFGYIWYDCFHYWSHHGWALKKGSYLYNMRSYHMKHHFHEHGFRAGFGITSTLWDHLFGSVLRT